MHRPCRLVSMEDGSLGIADRQLAVAPEPAVEQQHVPWAVHRLERVERFAVLNLEDVLAVLVPVAAPLPELHVPHQRRLYFEVPARGVLLPPQVLECVPQDHAFRMPQGGARRDAFEVEEVELRAERSVVAPARLLEAPQVRLQVLARVEGRTVDARQLRLRFVAAPVRAGDARQLHGLDRT